jgi:hypothetical protein
MVVTQIKELRDDLLTSMTYDEIAAYCTMSKQSITTIINRRGSTSVFTKKHLLERLKELKNTKEGIV